MTMRAGTGALGQTATAARGQGHSFFRKSADKREQRLVRVASGGALGFDLGAPRRRSASTRDLSAMVQPFTVYTDGHRNNQEPGDRGAASCKMFAVCW